MKYSEVFQSVSKELGIPVKVVSSAYRHYWMFIKKTIHSLPLKDDLSEEEFSKLRTNFNIPELGKLNCTYDGYQGVKKAFYYKVKNKKGEV